MLKEENCQPRIPYQAELSFRNGEEIKTILDKQKLRELITTTPVLREMLERSLEAEDILISKTKTWKMQNTLVRVIV